jgi:hypothetical protein
MLASPYEPAPHFAVHKTPQFIAGDTATALKIVEDLLEKRMIPQHFVQCVLFPFQALPELVDAVEDELVF